MEQEPHLPTVDRSVPRGPNATAVKGSRKRTSVGCQCATRRSRRCCPACLKSASRVRSIGSSMRTGRTPLRARPTIRPTRVRWSTPAAKMLEVFLQGAGPGPPMRSKAGALPCVSSREQAKAGGSQYEKSEQLLRALPDRRPGQLRRHGIRSNRGCDLPISHAPMEEQPARVGRATPAIAKLPWPPREPPAFTTGTPSTGCRGSSC